MEAVAFRNNIQALFIASRDKNPGSGRGSSHTGDAWNGFTRECATF
jgi:hypothetical protein